MNKSKDHLWKKGQSGNPNGRPKGSRSVSDTFRKIASSDYAKLVIGRGNTEQEIDLKTDGCDIVEAVAVCVIDKALNGDLKAADMMFDRLDGKAPQAIDMTTTTTEPSPFAEMSVDELRDFKDSLTRSK